MTTLTILNSDLEDGCVPFRKYKDTSYTEIVFEAGSTCTTICGEAFFQMPNLTHITFPPGLQVLAQNACSQTPLTEIVFPDSLTEIGETCFADCTGLSSVAFPPNVLSIGVNAFHGCNGIQYLDFNSSTSLTTISPNAFNGCSNTLNGIVIPDTVTRIGELAFTYNGLISVHFGENSTCTSIDDRGFFQCQLLQTITLPNSLTHIGEYVCSDCAALQLVVIPASVRTIRGNAFWNIGGGNPVSIYFEGPPPDGSGGLIDPNAAEYTVGYISADLSNGSWSSYMSMPTPTYRGLSIQVSPTKPPVWNGGDVSVSSSVNMDDPTLLDLTVSWNANPAATSYSVVDETGLAYPNQTFVEAPGSGRLSSVITGVSPGYHICSVAASLNAVPWSSVATRSIAPRNGGSMTYARGVLISVSSMFSNETDISAGSISSDGYLYLQNDRTYNLFSNLVLDGTSFKGISGGNEETSLNGQGYTLTISDPSYDASAAFPTPVHISNLTLINPTSEGSWGFAHSEETCYAFTGPLTGPTTIGVADISSGDKYIHLSAGERYTLSVNLDVSAGVFNGFKVEGSGNVLLDGDGYTVTMTASGGLMTNVSGASLLVKGLTVDASGVNLANGNGWIFGTGFTNMIAVDCHVTCGELDLNSGGIFGGENTGFVVATGCSVVCGHIMNGGYGGGGGGGICGGANNGIISITDCTATITGSVTNEDYRGGGGGMCGGYNGVNVNASANISITNCASTITGSVRNRNDDTVLGGGGGMCGGFNGSYGNITISITNCSTSIGGDVTNNNLARGGGGGMCGGANGYQLGSPTITITNCEATITGNVTNDSSGGGGGMCGGYNETADIAIINCFAEISGVIKFGSILGADMVNILLTPYSPYDLSLNGSILEWVGGNDVSYSVNYETTGGYTTITTQSDFSYNIQNYTGLNLTYFVRAVYGSSTSANSSSVTDTSVFDGSAVDTTSYVQAALDASSNITALKETLINNPSSFTSLIINLSNTDMTKFVTTSILDVASVSVSFLLPTADISSSLLPPSGTYLYLLGDVNSTVIYTVDGSAQTVFFDVSSITVNGVSTSLGENFLFYTRLYTFVGVGSGLGSPYSPPANPSRKPKPLSNKALRAANSFSSYAFRTRMVAGREILRTLQTGSKRNFKTSDTMIDVEAARIYIRGKP